MAGFELNLYPHPNTTPNPNVVWWSGALWVASQRICWLKTLQYLHAKVQKCTWLQKSAWSASLDCQGRLSSSLHYDMGHQGQYLLLAWASSQVFGWLFVAVDHVIQFTLIQHFYHVLDSNVSGPSIVPSAVSCSRQISCLLQRCHGSAVCRCLGFRP